MTDDGRLDRILTGLSDADAEWLRKQLGRPAMPPEPLDMRVQTLEGRAARLLERDRAVQAAAVVLAPGAPRTVAARAVAKALDRYLSSGWKQDCIAGLPEEAPAERGALFTVATWNGGRSLGWRQVANILDGARSPMCPKSLSSWDELQKLSVEIATASRDDAAHEIR